MSFDIAATAGADMSEYQYYEFQAIDRPLGDTEQEALRALSSRARITARRFTNHYEWGDFKGDPTKLMERYFDLHLYLANRGGRRLMIRLPKRLVDVPHLNSFLSDVDWVELSEKGDNLILDLCRDDVEGALDFGRRRIRLAGDAGASSDRCAFGRLEAALSPLALGHRGRGY